MNAKNSGIKPPQEKQTHADARSIFAHALEMVRLEPALRRYVSINNETNTLTIAGRRYDLNKYERIVVVGSGKAYRR